MKKSMESMLRGGQLKHLMEHEFHEFCKLYHLKRVDVEIVLAIRSLGRDVVPRDLMHCLDMNKGYVSQSLVRLENMGYINIETDLHDKRFHRIILSQNGEELSELFQKKWTTIHEQMIQGVAPEDYQCFLRVIEQISDNIEILLSK